MERIEVVTRGRDLLSELGAARQESRFARIGNGSAAIHVDLAAPLILWADPLTPMLLARLV